MGELTEINVILLAIGLIVGIVLLVLVVQMILVTLRFVAKISFIFITIAGILAMVWLAWIINDRPWMNEINGVTDKQEMSRFFNDDK